ncbi:unnamed protein product [Rotaria sp. Silwood2]|nr:unnamed protein product [Rotaria sp. Silwood2]CAF2792821.1 unnamed protein product [Rotaria sp. Silwood2]CAF3233918.1 unnamed protein product [Rotaria sp. Silwood2]CAF3889445.1 unnamed protein product [Rotaria sp. Silwood2]CAF3953080.1 unnamed protein product [Rotaria sp. Silwood2]
MTTLCTSCGQQVLFSSKIYKCRQCTNHYLCKPCTKLDRNRAIAQYHTFDKISKSNKTREESAKASLNVVHQQQKTNSSIFDSDDYLQGALVYCQHCHQIFNSVNVFCFKCDQCPTHFCLCNECLPQAQSFHPSIHKFSKLPTGDDMVRLIRSHYHLDITCDGCSTSSFNGTRHQCEECMPSFDLCDNCFGKKHTHHKFKIVPNPLIYAGNQQELAKRTLDLAGLNSDPQWRDPLSGWTKVDAERILEQANADEKAYKTRLGEITQAANIKLEQARQRLQDTIDFSWKMTLMNISNM